MWGILAACFALASASCDNSTDLATWLSEFTTNGTLDFPFDGERQTFTAYYSRSLNSFRIDYNDGENVVALIPKDGSSVTKYEIAPVTTENVTNHMTCFERVGANSSSEFSPSTIFPLLSTSEFICSREESLNGEKVQEWTYDFDISGEIDFRVLRLRWENSTGSPVAIPLSLELRSQSLTFVFDSFVPKTPSADIFNMDKEGRCLKVSKSEAQMVSTEEYDFERVLNDFEKYKKRHNKQYKSEVEHKRRFEIFRENYRFIQSKNRANLGYKLAINHLADRTEEELAAMRGTRPSTGYNGGQPFPYSERELEGIELPDEHDWRLLGAVTQIRDQGQCGSCWSFSASGTVEGAHFLKTGELMQLSSQALVDCSWGFNNSGCFGGFQTLGYQWIQKHGGLPSEFEYGGYQARNGYCRISQVKMHAPITGYVNVTAFNEKALKTAIFKHGPIAISINASPRTFSFYSSGVYYDESCNASELDHGVLAVGYGVMNGKKYWLVKNSWSSSWGLDGYMLISTKDNNCGVMTAPTYVTM